MHAMEPQADGAYPVGHTTVPEASTRAIGAGDADMACIDEHGSFLAQSETAPTSADADQLANYTAQTPKDRLIMLDNFFCANLANEDFIKLCEDVEVCWRRIGLGM